MIDLATELSSWLRTSEARDLFKDIIAEAVRDELRAALESELLDVAGAAEVLGMSEGALRKAVERGQVPCERIGSRLRFRRADLLSPGSLTRRAVNGNIADTAALPRPRSKGALATRRAGTVGERQAS